jgi:hypothetical protein
LHWLWNLNRLWLFILDSDLKFLDRLRDRNNLWFFYSDFKFLDWLRN